MTPQTHHERTVKASVRERDDHRCRACGRYSDEVAHIESKKMGGDHGLRTVTPNLLVLCAQHHRGRPSLHDATLRVIFTTDQGADGEVTWEERVGNGPWGPMRPRWASDDD